MPATKDKDLYVILGVAESASADEIKKKYRELAKKFHPDRTGGDKAKEQRFKEMSAAYEVLSDPKRRQQYDAMRKGGFRQGPGGAPDFSAFEGIEGIEELFGSIFGAGFGGARQRPGGGGRSRVVYESRPFSGGGGGFPGFGGFPGGFGDFSPPPTSQAAPAEQHLRTADGVELQRKGDDLHGEVEISFEEAVLGVKVPISTLDGRVTITIPAGTSSGRKLRLRGRGVGGRGDQYMTVKIVVPESIDKRAEELLKEFSQRAPVRPKR